MKYHIYKLRFDTGVHFGKKGLTDYDICFHSDSMFSALCQEAVKTGGQDMLNQLLNLIKEEQVMISDTFPFKGSEFYIPKPFIHVENQNKDGDSSVKKKFKKMKYIQIQYLEAFMQGEYPVENALKEEQIGCCQVKTSVSIRGMEETEPYSIKYFMFHKNCGLYLIVGYESKEAADFIEKLLISLSYSGIGGKRYTGLGRFELIKISMPQQLEERLSKDGTCYMTLSLSLPKNDELESALDGASYQLLRRSGFVSSDNYSDKYLRKKDLYVFAPGACFRQKFHGDVYDVSSGGKHPVYRYAKPLFLEVM